MEVDFKRIYKFQNLTRDLKKHAPGNKKTALLMYKAYRKGKSVIHAAPNNPFFKRMLKKESVKDLFEEGVESLNSLEPFLKRLPKGPAQRPISLASFAAVVDPEDYTELVNRLESTALKIKQAWQTTWYEFLAAKQPLVNPSRDFTFGNLSVLPQGNFAAIVAFPQLDTLWIVKQSEGTKYLANDIEITSSDNWDKVKGWPWRHFDTKKLQKALGNSYEKT